MTISTIRSTILDLTSIIEECHCIGAPYSATIKHRLYRDELRKQLRTLNT